jgi:aspartate/methionine/tyrosine aminotransferase
MAMSSQPPLSFAERVSCLEPFLAMEVMERAVEMEAAGIDVVHFELGEPDFAAPEAAVEACKRALSEGETKYTDSRGLLKLREAIASDCLQRFGASVDPGHVIVTSGTSPAMLLAFSLLVGPGDEVIYATPHYPCYPNFVRYCGGVPVEVACRAEDGFALDVEAVRSAVGARTKAIVLSSPANPTGAIQCRETMEALAGLGVPLVSDEIYDGLVYDDAQVTSALSLPGDAFVLDGFSKRYAMTGFRLGYLIAPDWALRPLQIMQQSLFISANRFVQRAGVAALEQGGEHLAAMRRAYAGRRDRMVEGLRRLGFGVPKAPLGAFYVLADARRFGADSRALAFELLERAHVGVTPGVDFGAAGEGMLRFCYAVSEQSIDEGLERLARVLPAMEKPASVSGGRS